MTVYLDKLDENGKRVVWKGVRIPLSNIGNRWKFMHAVIKDSGKPIDILRSLKPKQILELVLSNDKCTIEREDIVGYDTKPIIDLFKRCVRYSEEVNVYNIHKDGDNLAWWCCTASDDEIVRLILTHRVRKEWTKNMHARLINNLKPTTVYRLFEAIKEEPWDEKYGKESEKNAAIFRDNNALMEIIDDCKTVLTKNIELYYVFYDKLIDIYVKRIERGSRFMEDVKSLVNRLRRIEPRVYMTTATMYENAPKLVSRFSSRWDNVGAMRYYDTDYKKFAVRTHLNCGWSTPEKNKERYDEMLLWGSSGYKGIGFHNNMSNRMGLWQLI